MAKAYNIRPATRLLAGFAASALAVSLVWAPSAADAADPYYKGKEIEIVIPFAEGGAVDVSARFLTPFLEKHIAGNPTIRLRMRPGGGGVLGSNWFEQNAKPDGLTMLFTTSSTSHPYLLGQKEVKYDLKSKRIGYSLSWTPVIYVSPAAGIKNAAALKDAKGLVYGGISAAASDLPVLLAFELLKLDVKSVLGFTGRGPVRLAFDRGETNLDFQATPAYLTQVKPAVESGKAVPLMTGGSLGPSGKMTERDPVVPDLPSIYEVYKAMYGSEPSGPVWDAYNKTAALTFTFGFTTFLHDATPQSVLDELDKAMAAANADPEFVKKSKEVTGGYKLIAGREAEGPLRKALEPGGPDVNYIKNLLTSKYKVKL